MPPGHLLTFDVAQWALVAFVLAMTFLSGVLGGYLFGLARAHRHGSKSIWEYEESILEYEEPE